MRLLVICLLLALSGCGTSDNTIQVQPKTNEELIEESYIDSLELSAAEGQAIVLSETYFKMSTAQSGALATKDKCKIAKDTKLEFESMGVEKEGHVMLTLKKSIDGCAFRAGYFFKSHIQTTVVPVFSITVKQSTKFKLKNKPSTQLGARELCSVEPGKLFLEKIAEMEGDHFRVTLKPNQISCSFVSGYFFTSHLKDVSGSDADFAKVIRHILKYEGLCSNHPADYGGKTYKGITTSRARSVGWTADVCTMPDWLVLSIYKNYYWNTRPYKYVWPMNLAVMNTEVNSGGGKAQQFLTRMTNQNIQGTWTEKADWFVTQQTNFYRAIVASDGSQSVFLNGWLNRSNYMKDVIWGRAPSLTASFAESEAMANAKAYEQPDGELSE